MLQTVNLDSVHKPEAITVQAKLDEELAVLAKWEADGLLKGYLWGAKPECTSKVSGEARHAAGELIESVQEY